MTSFLILCMSLILGQRIPVLLWGNSGCTDGPLRIFCMSSIVYSELFIFFFPMQSPSPKKKPGILSYVLLFFFHKNQGQNPRNSHPPSIFASPHHISSGQSSCFSHCLFSLLEYMTNLASDSHVEGFFPRDISIQIHNQSQ